MEKNYWRVLDRLSAYRLAVNKTQEEMGEQFCVTQSHYCKMESGNKIISYQSLKNFEKNGGDVYFLLTGEKQIQGPINDYIRKCKTKRGKTELFKIGLWLLNQGIYLQNSVNEPVMDKTLKSLKLAEMELNKSSVWENIRKIEDLSQVQMADKLDINIKRYRRIEKMYVNPDAEILNTLYEVFGYSPLIILDAQLFYTCEIDRIWNEFPDEIKDKLYEILQRALELINQYAGSI